jgi:hypothetical protein
MPRFYFHLRSAHKTLPDCEGALIADSEGARRQAQLSVRDFLEPTTGRVPAEWEDWRIDICDERGRWVFSIAFSDAAALGQCDDIGATAVPVAPRVVYLEVERAKRELAAVEAQIRRAMRRITVLVECTRHQADGLCHIIKDVEETRQASRQLVQRSRAQRSRYGWLSFGS